MENNNLAEKLSEILNDPEGMARIESLAQSLLSGDGGQPEAAPDAIDGVKLAKILGTLKNSSNDNRSQLLLALRPHLSTERQEKVDKAIKLLRLVSLLPLLQESGVLSDFI